jgi:hypothetical protein
MIGSFEAGQILKSLEAAFTVCFNRLPTARSAEAFLSHLMD